MAQKDGYKIVLFQRDGRTQMAHAYNPSTCETAEEEEYKIEVRRGPHSEILQNRNKVDVNI